MTCIVSAALRLISLAFLVAASAPVSAQTVTTPTQVALVCAYNSSPPAPVAGQFYFVQCTSDGKLITSGGGGSLSIISGTTTIVSGANKSLCFDDSSVINCSSTDLTWDKTTGTFSTTNVSSSGYLSSGSYIISAYQLAVNSDMGIITIGQSNDAVLTRDGPNILALRNGTNAQTFRVYNTYTNASNGEWGTFDWTTTANTLTIGTAANGTGTVRNLALKGGTTSLTLGSVIAFAGGLSLSGTYGGNGNWWSTSAINLASTAVLTFGASDTRISRIASGILKLDNGSTGAGVFTTNATTVSGLPSAATAGAGGRAYVTDATACTFGGTITGGGSTACPIVSNGTSWTGG